MIKQLIAIVVCVVGLQLPGLPAGASFNDSTAVNNTISATSLAAPTSLSLVPNGNPLACALTLQWMIPAGSPATSFVIQRYYNGSPSGAPVTVGGAVTSLLDNTVAMLLGYTYKIHAVLGGWTSPDTSLSYSLTSGCL